MKPAVTELIALSRTIGQDISLVQGGGGNISVKVAGALYIKASGTPLRNMSTDRGWVTLGDSSSPERPSMEWPMHQVLQAPWVCHTHSVYLNVFGCMANSNQLFSDYTVLPYIQPGKQLAQAIQPTHLQSGVTILRNHGLLVTGKTAHAVLNMTLAIHQRFADMMPHLFDPTHVTHQTQRVYFPDAAILSDNCDVMAANNYIEEMILALGGEPQALNQSDIGALREMEEEQYRQRIV